MNKKIIEIVTISLVASIYATLTMVLQPLSYGPIQFRVAEVLVLLVCYNKKYTFSVTIGCLISNILSKYGLLDIIFGTAATFLSCIIMMFIKKRLLASLIPPVINGIIVGLEIYIMSPGNFFIYAGEVFLSEFAVVVILGNILFSIFEKNKTFQKLLIDSLDNL